MKEPLNGLSILEELDLKFGSAKNKQQIIHALEHSTILHRIPLPAPNVTTEQAQKDFRRERVLLNDVPFIPDKFDTDRCHAFSFTLQVLLERMMRQTQIYNQDLYSSSAVITDLIMQRACRTSAGADSFFTVQKLLCVEGTFVTQRAFLIDPPIKIDVFIADPEPDEVNGIPLVAVGEVVKTSNEFNNEPETKLQLHHPLKTLNNVNNTDNNSSSIINSSNNSTRSDSPKSHSNADNKNQKNSNSSSRSNLFSTATRITSNSRPFSTSDVSSSSSNNNITNCTLVSSTTPSQIVLSSSTASSPSIDASSSSPGCSSMVIPPDNIATTITAPVPVIGEGSSEARNSLLIHTPSIDEWSANTEVMYCNHKDENTDKPQHHHQQQQQSYQNEHTETDGCAHRQNNNMEFNSTMCSSSDSYITLVDSTTNYPIPLKDNNNNSSINTITASNDSTNKPINDCRPSMIHNSNSSSNAGSNNKPIITSIRGATLSCHPAPLPKTPQLPPPLPTVASSSSYSNNNNINSSMTNSSDGTNAGRRKVYSNPTPATTNALLSSSSMKGLSTTGSTSLKSTGTCSSNKITTTTTVPTTTKARELLLSPSPASSSKVPAVLAYANNTTCGAICSRIQVMNSFAIYDVSAIEQITGIAADDPPAWLEVEAIVVDESNFFTGKHWRKLQLVVTCQATGKVYTSSGDASVAKRVSGRLSGRMILQELSSWFITATTSGNNNNNSNHNNNNITTTTTTTGIGAYNNHHIKKTYSNVSALPDGSDGNNNTTSNMNNNNNNKHIPVPSSPPINNSNNNNSSSSIMNSSPPPHHHHHSHRLGIMRRVYTGIQDATGLRNSSSNNSSNNTSNLSLKNNVHNNSNCNIICNDTHNNNSNSSISNKGCNQDSENNMHDMNMKNGSRYNEDDGEVEEDKIRPYSSSTNRTRTLTATPTSSGIFTCSTPPPLPSLSSSAAMTIPVLPALPLSPSSSTAATNAADALANTPTIVESVSVFTTNGCGDDVGDENIIYGASSSSIVSCPYSLHSTNTPSSSSSLALSNSFDTQLQLAATLPHQKLLLPVLSSSATTTSFVATGQPDTTTTNSHNLLATTSSNNDNANVTTTSPILSQLAHVIVQNDLLPHQSIKSTISSASSNYTTNTSTAAAVVNKISDDEEEDELLSEIASISSESL